MATLLEQPTRRRIFDVVVQHPGSSAREVQRRAQLGWGETAYHLDQLTRAGILRRERGGRRDYYFPAEMSWDDRRVFQSLRSAAERRILLELVDRPGRTLSELRTASGLSLSTTSFHVRHLLRESVIEGFQDGSRRRYRALRPERVREFLHHYQESFEDRWVDRFVEAWSGLFGG